MPSSLSGNGRRNVCPRTWSNEVCSNSKDSRLTCANPQGSSFASHSVHMAAAGGAPDSRRSLASGFNQCTRLQPGFRLLAFRYVVCGLVTMRWPSCVPCLTKSLGLVRCCVRQSYNSDIAEQMLSMCGVALRRHWGTLA